MNDLVSNPAACRLRLFPTLLVDVGPGVHPLLPRVEIGLESARDLGTRAGEVVALADVGVATPFTATLDIVDLAVRHKPVIHLQQTEFFSPTTIDAMLLNCRLLNKTWTGGTFPLYCWGSRGTLDLADLALYDAGIVRRIRAAEEKAVAEIEKALAAMGGGAKPDGAF